MPESEIKIKFKIYVDKIYEEREIDKNLYDIICEKINNISEKDLIKFIKENNLVTYESIKDFFLTVKENENKSKNIKYEKIDLNEFYHIFLSEKGISFHFTPLNAKEFMNRKGIGLLHSEFDNAMKMLVGILKENESVSSITAVSHLIKKGLISSWFNEYGFTLNVKPIEEAKDDPILYQFYEKFKNYNGKSYSSIGMAYVDTDKFLELMEEKRKL